MMDFSATALLRPSCSDSWDKVGASCDDERRRGTASRIVDHVVARTAKKVDVRALKDNMWKGMIPRLSVFSRPDEERVPTPALTDDDGDTDMTNAEAEPAEIPDRHQAEAKSDGDILKFTEFLSDLKHVYPEQQMKDISTSYGFICLLHLANEKGLVLEGGREEGTMNEIMVRKDPGVGEGYVGE